MKPYTDIFFILIQFFRIWVGLLEMEGIFLPQIIQVRRITQIL